MAQLTPGFLGLEGACLLTEETLLQTALTGRGPQLVPVDRAKCCQQPQSQGEQEKSDHHTEHVSPQTYALSTGKASTINAALGPRHQGLYNSHQMLSYKGETLGYEGTGSATQWYKHP